MVWGARRVLDVKPYIPEFEQRPGAGADVLKQVRVADSAKGSNGRFT